MIAIRYLQQANEITACDADPHVWQTDGSDSTLFGVEPQFGCCTANFNQGWPKFASSALLQRKADGAILVALLAPISTTLVGGAHDGASVVVDTEYPFEDEASPECLPQHTRASLPPTATSTATSTATFTATFTTATRAGGPRG